MVCQIKVREKRDKRDKPLLMCRIAVPLPVLCGSGTLLPRNFDKRISTGRRCLAYTWSWSHIWIGGSHSWHLHRLRIYETSGVAFSELSKLLNQGNALSVPCLKRFRNYCGPIKLATCGFPWEKTTTSKLLRFRISVENSLVILETSYFVWLIFAKKRNRSPERPKIVNYQVTIRGHFRGMSSPVSRIFCQWTCR
jgi:hypothetical protein